MKQPSIDESMQTCQIAIDAARSTKVLYSMSRRHLPEIILDAQSYKTEQSLRDNTSLIETLVPCGKVSVISSLGKYFYYNSKLFLREMKFFPTIVEIELQNFHQN